MKFLQSLVLFFHIVFLSLIAEESNFSIPDCQTEKPIRITLSVTLGNEADNYLVPFLEDVRQYITDAVIIDDATTDNTIPLCRKILQGIPVKIVRNETSKFANEIELRKQQWEETVMTNPDWILFLDADQIFENKFKEQVKQLIKAQNVDAYYFRLYDFWDDEHYREDSFWCAHYFYRPFLIRYKKGVEYKWKETPQHCGSFPQTIMRFPMEKSEIRVKHYGWAIKEDRQAKYNRYQKLDPGAKYGWKEQYESILDPSPHLVKWEE